MVASLDRIVEALNRDTHLRVQNEVGAELSGVLRNYETEVRASKSIANPQAFTADVKGALKRALENSLKLTPRRDGIKALSEAITASILSQYFNFNENSTELHLKNSIIDNYDDFAYGFIQNSRDATVRQLVSYGQQGVEGHMQDSALRPAFFNTIERRYFPTYAGVKPFSWTTEARGTSMDVGGITQILAAAASGTINPRLAIEKPTLLMYTP